MYVKGRLMCTRAFGDLALKLKHFNVKNGKFSEIKNWDGPYITHEPDVIVKELTSDMKYVVMGSDGLWDEISLEQCSEIVL
jgi:pyruvate dehydrogenase phosphatase